MSLDLEIKCSMEDCDQCVELIVRAKQCPGAFESVMTRVNRIEAGHHTEFMACGLADGDYAQCDEIAKPYQPIYSGSMSNAAISVNVMVMNFPCQVVGLRMLQDIPVQPPRLLLSLQPTYHE